MIADTQLQADFELACEGDEAAFERFTERIRHTLLRVCTPLVGREEAHDAVQEALLRSWIKRRSYRPELGPAVIWVTTIALNVCRDKLSEASWQREIPTDLIHLHAESDTASSEDPEFLALNRVLVVHLLLALPLEDAAILSWRHMRDIKEQEVAEIMSIPKGSIHGKVERALRRARKWMEANGVSA